MRVALVTAATKNIGFAIARALGLAGAAVVVNGRNPQAVDDACDRLRADGVSCAAAPGDVSREWDVAGMVDVARAEFGPVDVLVNNAGIRCHGPLVGTSLADWSAVLATSTTGAFLTTREVLGGMTERGWGRIVNIAGLSGQSGAAGRVAVVTAKSAVIGLTKATALEVAASGVTANAISPGLIDTDRSRSLGDTAVTEAFYRAAAPSVPVGRLGRPEEIAALCAFLCSDDAAFITGQVYAVNGGAYL